MIAPKDACFKILDAAKAVPAKKFQNFGGSGTSRRYR
jgi:hypothetical protein